MDVWDDENLHLPHYNEKYVDPYYLCLYNPFPCGKLEKFIVPFAKGMSKLVCLGLSGFRIEPRASEVIRRRLTEELVPLRPAFWFYLDDKLPNKNDASGPRVHYGEIVTQFNAHIAPPDILNLK